MTNVKLERLNHIIQEEISIILMKEVKDKELKFVTITGVETTNDLSFSKVYYTVLQDQEKVQEIFKKASPFIRTKLAERIDIRHTPELKFIYDTSIEYGEHIEKVIEEIKKKEED